MNLHKFVSVDVVGIDLNVVGIDLNVVGIDTSRNVDDISTDLCLSLLLLDGNLVLSVLCGSED